MLYFRSHIYIYTQTYTIVKFTLIRVHICVLFNLFTSGMYVTQNLQLQLTREPIILSSLITPDKIFLILTIA